MIQKSERTRFRVHVSLLGLANVLIPLSILVFASGFFPYKPHIPGLAEGDLSRNNGFPKAPFDKLIFMVVDALRSDFVFSNASSFRFTQSLIRDGAAMPFTANARPPTVTMPRIKAITTGSIPSFVDLLLNFYEKDTSTLESQDTWLAQIKAKEKGKLLLYGDDTWLKLFPHMFDRFEGTTSFFVSDFTEVDNNVTRNIATELDNSDWALMVLHYLGLDHIGHKAGPKSSNMAPKQQEMDNVVEQLFEALLSKEHLKSTLLVLCGDHGMNDAGNHGASSPGETSAALLFISPWLKNISSDLVAPAQPKSAFEYYTMVEQSDIAPTIAALLGLPISRNNLGALIPEFLSFWSQSVDQKDILMQNLKQVQATVTAVFDEALFEASNDMTEVTPCAFLDNHINTLACEWRNIANSYVNLSVDTDRDWFPAAYRWLRSAQSLMCSLASKYNLWRLSVAQALAVIALAVCPFLLHQSKIQNLRSAFFAILTLAYGTMMFASSFVEEEQQFWYWFVTLWISVLGFRALRRKSNSSTRMGCLVALLISRLIRSWNQTGQKFAGNSNIVKSFVSYHPQLLWSLVASMYIRISYRIFKHLKVLPIPLAMSLVLALASASLTFKLGFVSKDAPEMMTGLFKKLGDAIEDQLLTRSVRLNFLLIAVLAAAAVFQSGKGRRSAELSACVLHDLSTMLVMTQSRVTNMPLFLFFWVLSALLQHVELSVSEITTSCVLGQFTSFFAMGGSNAISSIDLSNAYNGASGFNVSVVALLTFISNWAGPIFWTSATNLMLLQKYMNGRPDAQRLHLVLLTGFAATSIVFVMGACIALKEHLFIWTVFSPKFLYTMAWCIGQHLIVNVGWGSLLFWLGSRWTLCATLEDPLSD